jgi:hypothetical protein
MIEPYIRFVLAATALVTAVAVNPSIEQTQTTSAELDSAVIKSYRWRSIGPDRGGRSIAATGVRGRPKEAYFGATGGGLWKYRDDKTGAIDISVDRTNPNVLYAALWEWNPSYGSDVMESHILLLREKAEKELGEEEGDDEPRAGSSAFRLQASSGPGREPDRAASRSPRGWPRT